MNMVDIILDEQVQKIIKKIEAYDPIDLAISFASLNTLIEQRNNINSIIVLTHLALMYGKGELKATPNIVNECMLILKKGYVGQQDDPHENLFINNICSYNIGNSYILEGIWHNPSYYLQLLIDYIDLAPSEKNNPWGFIKLCVYNLLKLSHLLCLRADLHFNNEPVARKNAKLFYKGFHQTKEPLIFSYEELIDNGIEPILLELYSLEDKEFQNFINDELGNTSLEHKPLFIKNNNVYILHPTAIVIASISSIMDFVGKMGALENLSHYLIQNNIDKSRLMPFMQNLNFIKELYSNIEVGNDSPIISLMYSIDTGVYFNIIYVFDPLDNIEQLNFLKTSPKLLSASDNIQKLIDNARNEVVKDHNFYCGYTLVVVCGFGRATFFQQEDKFNDWGIEVVSNSELEIIGWLYDIDPEFLIRIADAEKIVKKEEIDFIPHFSMNLLNILGIVKRNNSLIDHNALGMQKVNGFINDYNAALSLKYTVAQHKKVQMFLDDDYIWQKMLVVGSNFFAEDNLTPTYINFDKYFPTLVSIDKFSIWIEIEAIGDSLSKEEIFKLVHLWVKKSLKYFIENKILKSKDIKYLSLYFEFKNNNTIQFDHERPNMQLYELLEAYTYVVEPSLKKAQLIFSDEFELSFCSVDNIADQAIVMSILQVFDSCFGLGIAKHEFFEHMHKIVPHSHARQMHAFTAQTYRDHISRFVNKQTLLIDELDTNNYKFGLAWKEIEKTKAPIEYKTIEACKKFINSMVFHVITEIRENLRLYNRVDIIEQMLEYYEANACDDVHWTRTTPAMLAIHDDKKAIINVITDKKVQRNNAQRSLRLLIEIALCDSPLEEGKIINKIALSKLMDQILFVQHFGTVSDAICYEAIAPFVRVTCLGDIHINYDFIDNVVEPFSREIFSNRSEATKQEYSKYYSEQNITSTVNGILSDEFLDAWNKDLGFSVDDLRVAIDSIELLAMNGKSPCIVLDILKADLILQIESLGYITENIKLVIDFLVLETREDWLDVPSTFNQSEIYPWLYRRRLSLIMKPILQINNKTQRLLISVPFLRDALGVILKSYYNGTLRDLRDRKQEKNLHKWKGTINNKIGTDFNNEVAMGFVKLGWNAHSDIKVTQILNQSFEIDYGDVDVLAWDIKSGRVLIIECKNLQFKKTTGEIAEQIASFKGVTNKQGKRDLLKRHLDRVEILKEYKEQLHLFLKSEKKLKIESYIMFKNIVPMTYSMEALSNKVSVCLFDDLQSKFQLKR